MSFPANAELDSRGAGRKLLGILRLAVVFSLVLLANSVFVLAIIPENPLADAEENLLPALLTKVMGGTVLVLLLLAFALERVLRSPAPRLVGLELPSDPLARYRQGKWLGIILRDLAGGVGFVLELLVANFYGYAAMLLAALALVLAWPRTEDLPAEETAPADSLAPG